MEQQTEILDAEGLKAFLSVETPEPKEIKTVEDLFEETPKEEVKEVKSVEQPKQEEQQRQEEIQAPKGSDYSELVKSLIEKGDWGDYKIVIKNDEGEEEDVDILTLDHIDKELFLELKELQEAEKLSKFKETHISKEGIDPYTEKLIEISREGGDISQLIQTQSQFINPVLKIKENRDEKSLIDLVAFKMQNQGYEPDYINLKITKFLKDGTLDEEADKVIEEIETNYNNHLENTQKALRQQKEQIEKERKEYKKTLSEKLKSFNLKEHDSRSVIEIASKYDSEGISEAEKLFYKTRHEDPERFLEVVMLLKDRELFESVKFTKVKNSATIEAAKKVLSLKPKTTTSEKIVETKKTEEDKLWETPQQIYIK